MHRLHPTAVETIHCPALRCSQITPPSHRAFQRSLDTHLQEPLLPSLQVASMQAQSGCAVGAPVPGNRIVASNFCKPTGSILETGIGKGKIPADIVYCSKVVTAKAVSRSSEAKLGVEQIMTYNTISPPQQFACAGPGYHDKTLFMPNADSMPIAVAEFRGPVIHGLVQFVQLTSNLASIEATFDGLDPGAHSWSVNEYGDLTRGPASTGSPYNPPSPTGSQEGRAAGELGNLQANSSGHAKLTTTSRALHVADVIGRSVVVYGSTSSESRLAAAVIARSAGRSGSAGRQTLCKCDGTIVWDSEVGCV